MQNSKLYDKFHTGCNYWASNAGCFMWQNWDAEVVENDFRLLSGSGLKTLRVFPIWSDFQPLKVHYGEFGTVKEVRCGENPIDGSNPESLACINPLMLERFEKMCELAEKYDLQLTVMLLTGWMSGRQFKPEPLHDKDIFTDPFALKWQVRFVDYFVSRFKGQNCIIGWGLGNETNIMGKISTPDAAFSWTALIAKTIKCADGTRPVISGMHGLTADGSGLGWKISAQGELTDILTTHPYSLFIKYLDGDKLLSIRNTINLAAESTLYSDLSGKPCMSEELGDLGRCICDEASSKTYLKTCLWSAWANNNLGLLWWCAFDQNHIANTPYDWFAFEQELGLFTADGRNKPAIEALNEFHSSIAGLPEDIRKLPPRKRDAVCILSSGQDNWAAALSAFVLSKQAGFDIMFTTDNTELPDSELYMLPSLCGYAPISRRMWTKLLQKVHEQGATLYVSSFDALLPDLANFAGVEVVSRSSLLGANTAFFDDGSSLDFPADTSFVQHHREGGFSSASNQYTLELKALSAKVLAKDADGNPLFTCNKFGNGLVYFLNFGLEMILAKNPFTFEPAQPDYSRFYRIIGDKQIQNRCLKKESSGKGVLISEFPVGNNVLCVAVNHYCKAVDVAMSINSGFKVNKTYIGDFNIKNERLNCFLDKGEAFIVEFSCGSVR